MFRRAPAGAVLASTGPYENPPTITTKAHNKDKSWLSVSLTKNIAAWTMAPTTISVHDMSSG